MRYKFLLFRKHPIYTVYQGTGKNRPMLVTQVELEEERDWGHQDLRTSSSAGPRQGLQNGNWGVPEKEPWADTEGTPRKACSAHSSTGAYKGKAEQQNPIGQNCPTSAGL